MHKIFFLILFLGCMLSDAFAQSWEIGGFVGGSGYMGDINPEDPSKFTDLALGGQIKRNIAPYWSSKFSALHGKIR